jgi:hypothetical protein
MGQTRALPHAFTSSLTPAATLTFVWQRSWWVQGDKNFDGTPRPRRFGVMTMLAEKHGDRWEVVVAQNTSLMPGGPAPEEEGIDLPMPEPEQG